MSVCSIFNYIEISGRSFFMKKIISVLLAMLMILPFASMATAAKVTYSVPVVYMVGKQAYLVDENGTLVHPVETPDGYIMDAVKECLPYLLDSITSGDWTEYREKLLSFVEPLYTDFRMDGDGNPVAGTRVDKPWDAASLTKSVKSKKGKYSMTDFSFLMDWRLDPYVVADELHEYIETVKAAAGVEKVNGVFRCEACSVLAAYYLKYGYEDFNCVELYVSSLGGIDTIGAAFGGDIRIDSASLIKFIDGYEENLKNGIENDAVTEFLYDTLYLLKETYTIDAIATLIKPLIKKIYKELIAPCVLASYGTAPGMWTLVPYEDYENAKKNVFAGVEDEYAGLIAKLDRYQTEINANYEKIIKDAADAGVKTAIFAKYGDFPIVPISKANKEVTDGITTLTRSSFGAATPAFDKVIDNSYIALAEKNGTAKYISPDKKVDAATALFPDTTWIIYNSYHDRFADSIHNELMMKFFMSEGTLTVFDDPTLPQYLYCSDSHENNAQISPLTAENGFQTVTPDTTVNGVKKSVKQQVIDFVNSLLNMLRKFLAMLLKGELKF